MLNTEPLHYAAHTFLAAHEGAHLDHDRAVLIDRCVAHLIDKALVSKREAEVATLQAYGERESRRCNAYVDVSLTTSHTVFIRDARNGMLRVFTVAELIDLVKTPALASVPVPSTRAMLANGLDDAAGTL
ncbi:gp3 [Burkholderia phage KS14]|uniref:Gp3 n=2 Tax=Kisquattuordecimvirus TaxID=2732982 RepID=E5FFF6_9CAUD|nr:gp3 [Burkholderia phage KS14]ADP02348.1 gp3 [Burkholderia phage KS14]